MSKFIDRCIKNIKYNVIDETGRILLSRNDKYCNANFIFNNSSFMLNGRQFSVAVYFDCASYFINSVINISMVARVKSMNSFNSTIYKYNDYYYKYNGLLFTLVQMGSNRSNMRSMKIKNIMEKMKQL